MDEWLIQQANLHHSEIFDLSLSLSLSLFPYTHLRTTLTTEYNHYLL